MAVTDPHPGQPALNSAGSSVIVKERIDALYQGIQTFDGSQVQSQTIVEGALVNAINPRIRGSETLSNFVYTGGVAGTPSTLSVTFSGGTAYINGFRVTFSSNAFTVSINQDTYIYLSSTGLWSSIGVANNAASPSLPANTVLMGIIISNGTVIASVNQGSFSATGPTISSTILSYTDANGNVIYPTSPSGELIGYRQILTGVTTTSLTGAAIPGFTMPIIVPAGRRFKVSAYAPEITNSGANGVILSIWDGTPFVGTEIQQWRFDPYTGAAYSGYSPSQVIDAPSLSGPTTKTYNLGWLVGAGTATMHAAATNPAYIKAELV